MKKKGSGGVIATNLIVHCDKEKAKKLLGRREKRRRTEVKLPSAFTLLEKRWMWWEKYYSIVR